MLFFLLCCGKKYNFPAGSSLNGRNLRYPKALNPEPPWRHGVLRKSSGGGSSKPPYSRAGDRSPNFSRRFRGDTNKQGDN